MGLYAVWSAATTSKTITKNATAYVNNWIGVRTLVLYGATFTSAPTITLSGNIYDEAGNYKVNVVSKYKSFCIISGAHMSGGSVNVTLTISGTAYQSASAAGITTKNGTFSVVINNWNSYTQNVKYGVTYKSNPTVTWYATGDQSTAWNNNCAISNQSTTGCTMTFSGPSGGTWTNGLGWVVEGNT